MKALLNNHPATILGIKLTALALTVHSVIATTPGLV